MLSEDQLRSAYESGFLDPDLPDDVQAWELAALRAVEAAVREDERKAQIEKDAALVGRFNSDNPVARIMGHSIAAAIRAQREGTTNE